MNKRECPYCDHLNLANAKFCTACGAAMHLAPCPHCGAVNDISATACYRCHGELTPLEVLPDTPAGEEGAPPSDLAAGDGSPAESATLTEPLSTRPSLLVIGIILLAFAAASYYAFRQRSTIDARAKAAPVAAPVAPAVEAPPKPVPTPVAEPTVTAVTPPPLPAEPATASPVVKPAPTAAKPAPAIVKPASPPVKAPAAMTAAPPKAATPSSTPATPTPPAAPTAAPSAAPPPVCTEAVAALGLCKVPDAK